jgi:hypothetical protein
MRYTRNLAPIVLFTYNRLEETERTIKALKNNYLASDSKLVIYSDGPKSENDIKKVQSVRDYLKTISGFKKVTIRASQSNKGLADSIIDGTTEVINEDGKVIVLEDDLITSPNFLDFMNQAISFYEDDSEILSISGYTLALPSLPGNKDFYFGYRASSWGWATWQDRWEKVDWDVRSYNDFMESPQKRIKFKRGGSDMVKMLQRQQEGLNDSWAIRFCYHQFRKDLKTVFPTTSKVKSIGFSEKATHTTGTKRFDTELDSGEKREFEFGKFQEMNEQLVKEFRNKFSLSSRAWDKLRKILSI